MKKYCKTRIINYAWKYMMLIGIFSLISELFYIMISLTIYGDAAQPQWIAEWLWISTLFIFSSLFTAMIANYETIVVEIRGFLRHE